MAEDRWFFLEGQDAAGPFGWKRLMELLETGILNEDTYVWKEGAKDWIRLAEAMVIAHSKPPPIPADALGGYEQPQSIEIVDSDRYSASHDEQWEPQQRGAETYNASKSNWVSAPPAPWRRYAARTFDTIAHGVTGFVALAYGWYSFAPLSADAFFRFIEGPAGRIADVMVTAALAAAIGGLVIGVTGTTIGKWMFGIRVLDHQSVPIGVVRALQRELRVLLEGLGLGIPLISLFTMIASFQRLKKHGETSWDAKRNVVLYRPNGPTQYALNALGVLLTVSAVVGVQILSALP